MDANKIADTILEAAPKEAAWAKARTEVERCFEWAMEFDSAVGKLVQMTHKLDTIVTLAKTSLAHTKASNTVKPETAELISDFLDVLSDLRQDVRNASGSFGDVERLYRDASKLD